VLRPRVAAADPAPALAVEAEVLSRVNWVLGEWGQPPMQSLGQLYSDVDETFLTTFPELDHFRERAGAAYWGPVISGGVGPGAEAPEWPDGDGKRVFVYLKRTPVAGEVLRVLDALRVPTLAYVDGLDPAERKRLEAPTVRVAETGERYLDETPAPSSAIGRLAVPGPAGLLGFGAELPAASWRAARWALKEAVLGRALRETGLTLPTTLVVVGGPAGDDEALTAVSGLVPPGTVVGRANVAGALGHRHAVAWGLALTAASRL